MVEKSTKRLTVAFIGSKGIPARSGGVERHVQEVAQRLVRDGMDVLVYSRSWYTKNRQGNWKNIPLRFLPSVRTKHLDAITHTALSILDAMIRKFDIIHIHGIGPALLTPLARILTRSRIVVTLHCQDYYHQKWGLIARFALRLGEWCAVQCSHELIVVSRELQRHIWATYHRSAVYIPNGATLPTLKANPHRSTLHRLGLRPGYLLYVGRLIPHKGVHVLIEAYRAFRPKTPLIIVGAGSYTDEYVRSLKKFASPDSHIRFMGERNGAQLDALYRGASICIQPSQSEGLSLSLLEAMSYAKPVVISAIPENLEVMDDLRFSFHATDPKDLAHVLQWALRHPMESRRQARLNRATVRTRYHWDRIAADTIALYARLTSPQHLPSVELLPQPVQPS